MAVPFRTDINQVDIRALAYFFPYVGAAVAVGSRSLSVAGQHVVGLVQIFLLKIGENLDFRPFDVEIAVEGFHAATPQSDECHPDNRERRTGQFENGGAICCHSAENKIRGISPKGHTSIL